MSDSAPATDFNPEVLLNLEDHTPERPRFPLVDAHNHLFGALTADDLLRTMDEAGVEQWVNVSGNATLPIVNNTYTIARVAFEEFVDGFIRPHPDRFAALTMAEFARWDNFTLFEEGEDFAARCIRTLEHDVDLGARGLKVTKELGLAFRDADGAMVPVDDERLYPIWQRAGELGVPVLMHISDPVGFFLPIDERNEHLANLREFPGWSFHGSHFSKAQLLEQRNRVVRDHPDTTFILPHVANHAEDLAGVSRLLEVHPNVVIDVSARLDELGRQPYTAREFLILWQDRVLFGTDMPADPAIYRVHYRFFETRDEWFKLPDYIGRLERSRWHVHALDLPDAVLKKIYADNARRVIPGLGG